MRIMVTGAEGILTQSLLSSLAKTGKHDILPFLDFKNLSQGMAGRLAADKHDILIHLSLMESAAAYPENEMISLNGILLNELLSRAAKMDKPPLTILVISANQYGCVEGDDNPIEESLSARLGDIYSVSSRLADNIGSSYSPRLLPLIRLRVFELLGPALTADFEVARWASSLAQIEKGSRPPVIQVGNLNMVRDFLHVQDAVRAVGFAIDKGVPGMAYNICSGQGVLLREVLALLLSQSKRTGIAIEFDKRRDGEHKPELMVGNSMRFRLQTAWKPEKDLKSTLVEMLERWRTMKG